MDESKIPLSVFLSMTCKEIPLHIIRFKLLTKLFSNSYLVKNDAPLSVARGFIKKEWQKVFKIAGIKQFKIQWQWAFRYLIISSNE